MKAAGLTHGGFYGHFESKEDLSEPRASSSPAVFWHRWLERGRLASKRVRKPGKIIDDNIPILLGFEICFLVWAVLGRAKNESGTHSM
jgi:hypothetical protein